MSTTAQNILTGLQTVMSVAPNVISLIVGLTRKHAPVAEAQLGKGTGPAKLGTVATQVVDGVNAATGLGGIAAKDVPDTGTILSLVQATITAMKMFGELASTPTPAAPAPDSPAIQGVLTPDAPKVATTPAIGHIITVRPGDTITVVGS